jgi:hypothetical protein
MRTSLLFALALTAACGDSSVKTDDPVDGQNEDSGTTDTVDTAGSGGDSAQDSAEACDAVVVTLAPETGAVDVPIDAPVVATLSAPVTADQVAVVLDPAVDGTVSLAGDGRSLAWTPEARLARETAYTATVTVCESAMATSFTTVGEPTTAPIVGRTYDVELDGRDITWVKPSVGSLLVSQLETKSLLFMVENADAESIDLLGAAGYDVGRNVAQYPCAPPIDFATGTFASNPFFHVGPQDTSLSASGLVVPILQMEVEGRFATDAASITDITLQGLIDVRELGALLGGGDACDTLGLFGVPCVDCPDGTTNCVELEVRDASAPWRDGLSLDASLDPSADPACN